MWVEDLRQIQGGSQSASPETIEPEVILGSRIFVLDDNPANVLLMERLLQAAGYHNIQTSCSPEQALIDLREMIPDLIILDLHMPGISGYDVLTALRSGEYGRDFLPVLVFTADVTGEAKRKALELGASDFLTKPGDLSEIKLRVRNFLETRHLYRRLSEQNERLQEKVLERTKKLYDAQLEVVERLALAGDYRDDDTGEHCRRVGEMSKKIALEYGMPEDAAELVRIAAPLHDIGKVAVPDGILRKPGVLEADEFALIQRHTVIGGMILNGSHSEILQVAQSIALHHHERWDGAGYPDGLSGEDIPLVARIVAIADVFDALITPRPYKTAWPLDQAIAEIVARSGTQFDPNTVAAFLRVVSRVEDRRVA